MKTALRIVLFLSALAVSAYGQVQNLQASQANGDLVKPAAGFSIPSGATVTFKSGSTLDLTGATVTGFTGGTVINGTTNQIDVSLNPMGEYVLAAPQDIASTSSPQFASLTLTGGKLTFDVVSAPSTPGSGLVIPYADDTDLRLHDINENGTVGTTVVADAGASNNFLTGITTAGAITKAQPAFSNLSGNIAVSQMNSGTSASSSTYWRGDGTWATPAAGGNVSNTGTPTSGQVATWTSATVIQGVGVTTLSDSMLGLSGNGFVKRTGTNTYTNDTSTYLTGNQTITLTGDATGSGATSISTTVGKINGVALSGLATGLLKNTTGTGAPSIAVAGTDYQPASLAAVLASDFNSTNTTLTAITGFPQTLASGKTYRFRAVLFTNLSATGGILVTMDGSATVTSVTWIAVFTGHPSIASGNVRTALGSGEAVGFSSTTAADTLTVIEGSIVVNAGGTLAPYFSQSVASGTSTIMAGSTFTVDLVP
ncbi:MAG: hypothetical protein JSR30_00030 [Proteobacteria bacterium]|nr:hypothetical protein [Pseudomonadota bacterium]